MTVEWHLRLSDRQRFPTGDANLPGDQIQPGDCFGHRVLDLQPRVHLHEEKLAARIQQKLHGAGADITDRLRRTHSRFAHRPAQLGRQTRRRGFFDDFLVPTLDRAVALVEVEAVAVLIGEHLNLHMTWLEQILFHQHPRIAKRRLRFALRRGEGFSELADILDDFHAFAATTRSGLEQHRITNAFAGFAEGVEVLRFAVIARHQWHAGLFHQRLGGGFAAHRIDGRGGRAEEDQPGGFNGAGESSVFREKTVAGMNGLSTAGLRCCDDLVDFQVAVGGLAASQVHTDISFTAMPCIAVGRAVNGDGCEPQGFGGTHDPAGDFATVGDQHRGKSGSHGRDSWVDGSACQLGARFCRKARKPS